MSSLSPTVPLPHPDDHEDVAWALRAASAQWQRGASTDSIAWVERAAETAEEVGQIQRSIELLQLAEALRRSTREEDVAPENVSDLGEAPTAPPAPLSPPPLPPPSSVSAAAPPPPSAASAAPPPPPSATSAAPPPPPSTAAVAPPPPLPVSAGGASAARAPLPSIEIEVDLDEDIEFLDEDDEVISIREGELAAASLPQVVETNAEATPSVTVEGTRLADLPEFEEEAGTVARLAPPSAPPKVTLDALRDWIEDEAPSSSPTISLDEDAPAESAQEDSELALGEPVTFASEGEPVSALEASFGAGPAQDAPPESFALPVPVKDWAVGEEENLEFGELDFEEEAPTSRHSLEAPPPGITPPTYQAATEGVDFDLSSPAELAMSQRPALLTAEAEDLEEELGIDLSLDGVRSPARAPLAPPPPAFDTSDGREGPSRGVVGMASVRASRPTHLSSTLSHSSHLRASHLHSGTEPFRPAPSAELPPLAPVEPPSRPSQAPPAFLMREPEPELDSVGLGFAGEDEAPSGALPVSSPHPVVEPVPQEIEDEAPASQVPSSVVDNIHFLDVPGLQDLPEEAQASLLESVQIHRLERGEEVASFGVALVTWGAVQIMPTVADAACAVARKGEVVFTRGSFAGGVELRVVGFDPGTRVVVFSKEAYERAVADCPWVADELALVADQYQALAGAVMGPLGDSLDDIFRGMVLDKCSVKRVLEGESIAQAGKPTDGLYIVGLGSLEVLAEDGEVAEELLPGDFLFPETLLAGSPAPKNVRVGAGGALLLYANRMSAHELLATCPPFIELLAG